MTFKKGQRAWNKGKILTDEERGKYSEYWDSLKGKAPVGSFKKGHPYGKRFEKGKPSWNVGTKIRQGIYPSKRINNRKYQVSHIVWIQENQMPVPQGCLIHHRDGNCENNQIENLCLLPDRFHKQMHHAFNRGDLK